MFDVALDPCLARGELTDDEVDDERHHGGCRRGDRDNEPGGHAGSIIPVSAQSANGAKRGKQGLSRAAIGDKQQ
jgi:hypothetical protein